tara:strand:+ start:5862 stop:6566 length:705 start_codon:yes stop_codon:yes gene_type:complete
MASKKQTFPELSVIIPAAGAGHRMKSYGPKALMPVNKSTTLIEKQINNIWKVYPECEIFVCVGFEADKIREKLSGVPVRFICNPLYEQTNVLYSIALAIQAIITKEVLLVYGDLVFNPKTIENIRGKSKIIYEKKGMFCRSEVGVAIHEDKAKNFSFGLEIKWAQIAYFVGKELELFKEISMRKDTSQWLGYEALNYVLDNGGSFESVSPKYMKIHEIDRVKDLKKISKTLTFG